MVVAGAAIAALGGPPLVRLGRRLGLPAALAITLAVVLTVRADLDTGATSAWPKAADRADPLGLVLQDRLRRRAGGGPLGAERNLIRAVAGPRLEMPAGFTPIRHGLLRATNWSTRRAPGEAVCPADADHYVRVQATWTRRDHGGRLSMKAAIAKYGSRRRRAGPSQLVGCARRDRRGRAQRPRLSPAGERKPDGYGRAQPRRSATGASRLKSSWGFRPPMPTLRAGVPQPTMSSSVKNCAISSFALSALSEPWTEFSPTFLANSLRMVPSAAFSGLVAPITSR